jgi:hypothetical protein
MKRLLVALVRAYQLSIGRFMPPVCRYEPTCSQYMIEALRTHGALRGLGLGLWRICRCHPLAPGGPDPVPPARSAENDPTADPAEPSASGLPDDGGAPARTPDKGAP